MKRTIIILIACGVFILGTGSCYYDTESLLYPPTSKCDTTNVTYSLTIHTILESNACLSCHSGTASSGGNIVLDNYNSVSAYAANGKLFGSINHDPGFIPMPQGGNKLSDCDLKKVKTWITGGSQNN